MSSAHGLAGYQIPLIAAVKCFLLLIQRVELQFFSSAVRYKKKQEKKTRKAVIIYILEISHFFEIIHIVKPGQMRLNSSGQQLI